MYRVSILASLTRHAVVFCMVLAVFLGVTAATATASTAHAAPLSSHHLNDNNGRVLEHPEIHNLYMSRSWDSDNPADLSSSAIDDFTRTLITSGYFDAASQYGVHTASFTGSDGPDALCPSPIADGETDFLLIGAWLSCEIQPIAVPIVLPFTDPILTTTGVTPPDDNSVYVIYLPVHVQINDLAAKSCNDFSAYHFQTVIPAWHVDTELGIPVNVFQNLQDVAFAVVPAECAQTFDLLTANASHEIIEAATDPDIGLSWVDDSQIDRHLDFLKDGEAADICEQGETDVGEPPVRLPDGLLVAPYWSNAAGKCVPVTREVILNETGLPDTVPHMATFDGASVDLPFHTFIEDGSTHSYSFPSPVNDPNPGTRYMTMEPAATIDGTKDVTVFASYVTQHRLVVNTSGLDVNSTTISNGASILGTASASAPLDTWVDDGPLALSASANVNGSDGTQYFFQGFTPPAPATLTAPFTTTAGYETMQQLITNALTGPGASGLADSYTQEFAAVQADMAAHHYAQALSDLKPFINHVQAQSGNHLTTSTAQTFQLDALQVYHHALCLAASAGQITPATATADYSFYSTLVASLGGAVLPPC